MKRTIQLGSILPIILFFILSASVSKAQNSRSAVAYLDRGNASYGKGNLEAAIADYDTAIVFDPRYALAFFKRVKLFHVTPFELPRTATRNWACAFS